jgi:hypothetical protein
MGRKIVLGPINSGLTTNRTAFVINNESFPQLINAYQWRGRVKRKRGTQLLTRLTRTLPSLDVGNADASPWSFNLYDLYGITQEDDAQIVPETVSITIEAGPDIVFTDEGDGTLSSPTGGNSGTINYNTGDVVLTHTGVGSTTLLAFNYYPVLPVMGLKTFIPPNANRDQYVSFDTVYSYDTSNAFPYPSVNTNFYKNPPTSGTYTQKTEDTEFVWNGQDYQLFDTANYQGAMFAVNGITIPFVTTNIGMQFQTISDIDSVVAGPPASARITIGTHPLVVGDWVFINEVTGNTGINFQTGYVTAIAATTITVTFPAATLGGAYADFGIVQFLTNNSSGTTDCIKWYDGNPRTSNNGWVNFCPPLSEETWSVADVPEAQYYLVGARKIKAFKDRLLFFGAVIQASSGSPIYLQDTVVYSANGVPYYTASFTGDVSLPTTDFTQHLVPDNQTAFPPSWFEDQAGFGGYVPVGINQRINTVETNDDVLIVGLTSRQVRLIYTSVDLLPFQFYEIDSSLGSSSPQSTVNINDTVVSRGDRGFVATVQTQAARFDEAIPEQIFQSRLSDNGTERIHAIRDFIHEWVYFSYPSNSITTNEKFPNATLQYNYIDKSWGLLYESYTAYGTFTKRTGYTWATVGNVYPTWNVWNDPWNSGQSTLLQPQVLGGNQQGFVLVKGVGTGEGNSLTITDISGNTITSPNHGLNTGDYIVISGVLGTNVDAINDKIFSIERQNTDTFTLNLPLAETVTYTGAGLIKRMYIPFIQSKQFATDWEEARKTRLGPQQYLLSSTANGQVTLYIYLSMDSSHPYNQGPIYPLPTTNGALIFNTVLYTCPESTNLGLTPANINLQMPTAFNQEQIWHRINTSLLGDVVQFAITMDDEQMRDEDFKNQFSEIEFHGAILDTSPSGYLA